MPIHVLSDQTVKKFYEYAKRQDNQGFFVYTMNEIESEVERRGIK